MGAMLNTLRVKTNDLYIGLFVCGLDRPWLSTPFLTQVVIPSRSATSATE